MNKKNEIIEINKAENNKRVGKILIGVSIFLFIIGLIIIIFGLLGFEDAAFTFRPRLLHKNLGTFIFGGIINTIGLGLGIFAIVLIITNNKKIKDNVNEKIIPKAKETFNKAEPVVTDVIKTVGEGLEDIANNVKDTINKNKNNKKGE